MATFNIEPSSTSFTWNVARCSCILMLIFLPADILGVALYNVYYGADFALLCMTIFCAVILAMVGGIWFAYFDLKYAKLLDHYEEEIKTLAEMIGSRKN